MRRTELLDRGLMARVWALLNARDTRPRPRLENRTGLQANAASGDAPAELLVYDEIGWFGIEAADVVEALARIGDADLHVRVNSPGGDVFDGIAIYNAIAAHPGTVTVTVDGLAASAASVIAMAGDEVVMNRASQMMIHDASGLTIGNAADMREMADLLDRVSDMIAGVYADRAGGTVEDWRTAMRAETWYAPAEAVAAKLVDAMAPRKGGDDDPDAKPDTEPGSGDEPDAEPRKPAMTWDLSGFRFAGRTAAPPPPAASEAPGEQPVDARVEQLLDTAVGPHSTAVEDGTWDADAEQGKLPSPMPLATVRKMYGAYDADAVEDGKVPKSACHLPHHFVSSDGTPGAASINGVRNALARLPQTKGLSDEERATVERHLNGHLNAYKGGDEDGSGDTGGGADNSWDDDVAHLTHTDRADDEFAQLVEAL